MLTQLVAIVCCHLCAAVCKPRTEPMAVARASDLVIGYPPGGSNDTSRAAGRPHIGKHIPGQSQGRPEEHAGAGSFLAVNTVYNARPRTAPSSPSARRPAARREARHPGRALQDRRIQLDRPHRFADQHRVHVEDLEGEDIRRRAEIESTLSGTGVGSTVSIYPTVMNNVFGTKFKLVMGYKGSNEAQLAVERGEVEGHSTSWTAVKVAHPDWLPDKKIIDPGAVRAQAAPRAARRSDRGRARPQRRGKSDSAARSWTRPRSAPPSSPRPACRPTASPRCAAPSTPP